MFVSSGIGNAVLPARYGVPPEIVLLRIGAPGSTGGEDRANS
jgi:predicted MPP superfamily phosphohydrolase